VSRRFTTLAVLIAAICIVACAASQAAAAGLMAPRGICAESPRGAAAEEEAMLCLANYARAQLGEPALEPTAALEDSAVEKAEDIFRCNSFSHNACGREFTYWIRANGYLATECWHVGENLAWGVGEYGTVPSIFRAWLRSPEHRQNLLNGNYTQTGINLTVGSLEGSRSAHLWTQTFGSHC
jgi:uncharacterized protein YkwD